MAPPAPPPTASPTCPTRPSTSSPTTWTRSRPTQAWSRPRRRRPGQTGETPRSFGRSLRSPPLPLQFFSPPLLLAPARICRLHSFFTSSPLLTFSSQPSDFTASHLHLSETLLSPIVPPRLSLASLSVLSGLRHTRSLFPADTCVMFSPELLSWPAFQRRNFLFSCFLELSNLCTFPPHCLDEKLPFFFTSQNFLVCFFCTASPLHGLFFGGVIP